MRNETTIYFCRCGKRGVGQRNTTGEWLCFHCSVQAMQRDIENGRSVTVSLQGNSADDVLLVPGPYGKADLLARLVDSVHISFCRN